MNSKFNEFINLAVNKKLDDKLSYILIRETEWKNTYLLMIEDRKFIVQIRKKVGFYEHVVEALEEWNKKNCKVSKLIYLENTDIYIAYVFPYVNGEVAKDIILNKNNIADKKSILFDIGKTIRELCKADTNGFGWLVNSFTGQFNSWYEYLNNIIISNKNNLLSICSNEDINKIIALLDKNKEQISKINPKLLYVDINLGNVILENDCIAIIDYDYLISGDPLWVVSLFEVLYDYLLEKEYFKNGFFSLDEYIDKELLELYKILHLVQLSSSKNIESNESFRREKLLLELINNI